MDVIAHLEGLVRENDCDGAAGLPKVEATEIDSEMPRVNDRGIATEELAKSCAGSDAANAEGNCQN